MPNLCPRLQQGRTLLMNALKQKKFEKAKFLMERNELDLEIKKTNVLSRIDKGSLTILLIVAYTLKKTCTIIVCNRNSNTAFFV